MTQYVPANSIYSYEIVDFGSMYYWYMLVYSYTNILVPFLDFSYSSLYNAVQGMTLESCIPEQDSTRQCEA